MCVGWGEVRVREYILGNEVWIGMGIDVEGGGEETWGSGFRRRGVGVGGSL